MKRSTRSDNHWLSVFYDFWTGTLLTTTEFTVSDRSCLLVGLHGSGRLCVAQLWFSVIFKCFFYIFSTVGRKGSDSGKKSPSRIFVFQSSEKCENIFVNINENMC